MDKVVVKGVIKEKQPNLGQGAKWWIYPYCITLSTNSSGTFYLFFPSQQALAKHKFMPKEKVVIKGFLNRKSVRYQEKKCLTEIERALETDFVNYE